MPSIRLDLEEWQALYNTARAGVGTEKPTACLRSALLGIEQLFGEKVPIHHDCADSECEKALGAAVEHLAAGRNAYQVRGDDVDEAAAAEEPPPAEARLTALETLVLHLAQRVDLLEKRR